MEYTQRMTLETNVKFALADEWYEQPSLRGIKLINKFYRLTDESNLWPINGRFDATERAIRRVRRAMPETTYGYFQAIEDELTTIVNDPKNLPSCAYHWLKH